MSSKFNYSTTQKTAARLIERFGGSVDIISVVNDTIDPVTGAVTQTSTTNTTDGVVLEILNNNNQFTVVEAGDRKLLLDSTNLSEPPNTNDIAEYYDGTTYMIKEVIPLNPAGTDVMYTCRIGR